MSAGCVAFLPHRLFSAHALVPAVALGLRDKGEGQVFWGG